MTAEQVLQESKVEGLTVKLPPVQLDRKTYQDVAKKLELIGGKWKGGKVAGFVFQQDPTDLLLKIANGEKRNLKKEFQFFGTPDRLADQLVALAELINTDHVLEPSAGQGAIIKAIRRFNKNCYIDAFELMPLNCEILKSINETALTPLREDLLWFGYWQADFLEQASFSRNIGKYNKIIANPPFNKNQDIDHIKAMHDCLKKGGRLVSMASKHWQFANNKKETDFREWLDEVNATVVDVPAGEFKESGTTIATCIIIIDKV